MVGCNACLRGRKANCLASQFRKTEAWIIPETDDAAPHDEVAPVDEEIGRGEAPNPPPAASEAPAAPRPEETQGMRLEREARDLAAVWQSSRQLRQRPGEDEVWLADRAREPAEGGGRGELHMPRAPEEPSADERAHHEVTHLPSQPWCASCVMGKGRAKPHLQRPGESVKVSEFETDFRHLPKDPKRRHQPRIQCVQHCRQV